MNGGVTPRILAHAAFHPLAPDAQRRIVRTWQHVLHARLWHLAARTPGADARPYLDAVRVLDVRRSHVEHEVAWIAPRTNTTMPVEQRKEHA